MIVRKIHLDLWDFDDLIGTIESIIPLMEGDRDAYVVGFGENMKGFNQNAYQIANEVYILGKCLERLRLREVKMKGSNIPMASMLFVQVEIDVLVRCVSKYNGTGIAKLDSFKMFGELEGTYGNL